MINETSTTPYSAGPGTGSTGTSGFSAGSALGPAPDSTGTQADDLGGGPRSAVHRMAHKAHEAIDRLEQTLGSSSERMAGWQHEYGDLAREQVRASPLAAVGVAFGVGLLFGRLFMR